MGLKSIAGIFTAFLSGIFGAALIFSVSAEPSHAKIDSAAVTLAIAPLAQNGVVCPRTHNYCRPGQYGHGGCYRTFDSDCLDGKLCPRSNNFCRPGANGNGGCYRTFDSTCYDGKICPRGQRLCNGRCFDPQRSKCVT